MRMPTCLVGLCLAGVTGAFSAEPPLVITNRDLPQNPKVSVVGSLQVQFQPDDPNWIETVHRWSSEAESRRQTERLGPAREAPRQAWAALGGRFDSRQFFPGGLTCINKVCRNHVVGARAGLGYRPKTPVNPSVAIGYTIPVR